MPAQINFTRRGHILKRDLPLLTVNSLDEDSFGKVQLLCYRQHLLFGEPNRMRWEHNTGGVAT